MPPEGVALIEKSATTKPASPEKNCCAPYGRVPLTVIVTVYEPILPLHDKPVLFEPSTSKWRLVFAREHDTPAFE